MTTIAPTLGRHVTDDVAQSAGALTRFSALERGAVATRLPFGVFNPM